MGFGDIVHEKGLETVYPFCMHRRYHKKSSRCFVRTCCFFVIENRYASAPSSVSSLRTCGILNRITVTMIVRMISGTMYAAL